MNAIGGPQRTITLMIVMPLLGCTPQGACNNGGPASGSGSAATSAQLSATAVPSAPNTPSSVQLPMRLAEVLMTPDTHKAMVQKSGRAIVQALQASGQQLPPKFSEKVDQIVEEAMPYRELLAINADVYGKHFNTKELSAVLAFYETSAGKKLVREQAGIAHDVGIRVQNLVGTRWPKLAKKHGIDSAAE